MIQVSNEFKKAIKEPERRIKGYVEMLYDLPSVTVTATAAMSSWYTDISEICNGNRVVNLYGSEDYLPLDGSLLVMGDENINSGYITKRRYENLSNPRITLTFEETTIKGITMYFRTNIPTDLTINYSDGTTKTIQDNHNERIQVIFDVPKALTSVEININNVEHPERALYINEIDLGITDVYKDQNLIEFTVDEEVNKLVEEVPTNETNIILNNMSNLFNPLNPSGIVPYLSENTIIKPYIGVLTDGRGIEYVKMGEFYFDSYTNNSDATTTLVGKNIIKNLEKEVLKDDNKSIFFKTAMTQTDFTNFMGNYDYIINNINWTHGVPSVAVKSDKLLDFLKDMTFGQWNIMYADRDNKLNFSAINNTIKDNITKSELINDAEYKQIEKINTVRLYVDRTGSSKQVTNREVLKQNVNLTKADEIFLIQSVSPQLALATLSYSGGTSATIISQGIYMAFVEVTGDVGDTVTLTFSSDKDYDPYRDTQTKSLNITPEVVLEFDSFMNYNPLQYLTNSNILAITPSYEMRFDYNGDPSLEAGDYINVETPYGYKKLFIQKNRFKFDGGLEGSVEGVE